VSEERNHMTAFDASILKMFGSMARKLAAEPRVVRYLLGAVRHQRRAARRRRRWERRGIHVPPFAILSVTRRCNLHCAGCYAGALHGSGDEEMSAEKLHGVLEEARELGISIVLLAGGEPLARPDLLEVTAAFPEVAFPMFTNGTLIDAAAIASLSRQHHVIPVLSLEGEPFHTNARRGAGVHEQVLDAMARLRGAGLLFGTSITLTRENYEVVTEDAYVSDLVDRGCRLFFYVNYVPVHGGTEALAPTEAQAAAAAGIVEGFRERHPAWFLAFPGGEEEFGGCLAAGRGFIHIDAQGRVEPCPFSPFSDSSLAEMSLRDALASPLLQNIRAHGGELRESPGGCTLWENRAWVETQMRPGQPD